MSNNNDYQWPLNHYQQMQAKQQHQHQQQHQLISSPANVYDNSNRNINVNQHDAATYFNQQHQPAAATNYVFPQMNNAKFFESTNTTATDNDNNSWQTSATDGWDDWDWNDNTTNNDNDANDNSSANTMQQREQNAFELNNNSNGNQHAVIEESFSQYNPAPKQSFTENFTQNPKAFTYNNETASQSVHFNNGNRPNADMGSLFAASDSPQRTATMLSSSPPPPPPPLAFSSDDSNYNPATTLPLSPEVNESVNTQTTTAARTTLASNNNNNNIPSSVFMSLAKPVALPERQFAAPPTEVQNNNEFMTEQTIMPPQAFQNVQENHPTSEIAQQATLPPQGHFRSTSTTTAKTATSGGNPFKRVGSAQHHRAVGFISPASSFNQTNQNPVLQTAVPLTTEAISLPKVEENEKSSVANPPPNDERNQYLRTSHLSETLTTAADEEEQQPEADGLLPPPGLSRLVLGEPEFEANQRLVTGTENPAGSSHLSSALATVGLEERQADGQDTTGDAMNAAVAGTINPSVKSRSASTDRNLYLLSGESSATNGQRVVTGVENIEQREIDLDGENIEDQQNEHQYESQQLTHNVPSGTGPSSSVTDNLDYQSHQRQKPKDLGGNISSPNEDDSDELLSINIPSKVRAKYDSERPTTRRGNNQCYESDEDVYSDVEYSSEREQEMRRNYRESNMRVDRGDGGDQGDHRDEQRDRFKQSSRRVMDKSDKYYYPDMDYEERRDRDREKLPRSRQKEHNDRDHRAGDRNRPKNYDKMKSERPSIYPYSGKYEKDDNRRFEHRKDTSRRSMRYSEADRVARRADKSDLSTEYDEFNRPYRSGRHKDAKVPAPADDERREKRHTDREGGGSSVADEYEALAGRHHRSDKHSSSSRYHNNADDYDDYRQGPRSNRKSGKNPTRSSRMQYDVRNPASAGMYGYPPGYYDPYTAYYYNQIARANPDAYAEWYKKYYGHTGAVAPVGGSSSLLVNDQSSFAGVEADSVRTGTGTDGRESVHSGRSSVHKDRYTHAYIAQANEYQRHYHHHHHHQQQQQQQHEQQEQPASKFHQHAALYGGQTFNSTMLNNDDGHGNYYNNMNISSTLSSRGAHSRPHSNQQQAFNGNSYFSNVSTSTTMGNNILTAGHGGYSGRSDYAESRSGALSMQEDVQSVELQRLTPHKFINEHTLASLSSGILVTMTPKYAANGQISNVVKLLRIQQKDRHRKLFNSFPGPLVKGLTHKKTIIEFCEERLQTTIQEAPITIYAKQLPPVTNHKCSYQLMWNLLILLLRQNGMVVGTDIAELLLKNQQQFPYESANAEQHNADNTLSSSTSETLSDNRSKENEITNKFRNCLLYGNVNEALDWAADHDLWGHALFLASKLDRRTHANVMMKFANKLALNDPLQTLYQLMSGRLPASVTSVQDEKWGDWRPHLSMILSNTSQKPELDRKAIMLLGDSLFHRGDLYAAQFCYLMAQASFGRYNPHAVTETTLQQTLPKLVLLGSSHYKPFVEFAHNDAIIMTEIYEYACSLNDDKFSLADFQPYKFLLATRLLDYGYHLKCLMYLEQIAQHIGKDPTKYDNSFIKKVYDLSERLKFYDPALEKTTIDDSHKDADLISSASSSQIEEQKWLQNLRNLTLQQNKNNEQEEIRTTESLDYQQQQQQQAQMDQQQQIDQQFAEINKQFQDLNLQYQQLQPTADEFANDMNERPAQQPTNAYHNVTSSEALQQQQQLMPEQQEYNNQPYQPYTDPSYNAATASHANPQQNDNYDYWQMVQQQQKQVNYTNEEPESIQEQIPFKQNTNEFPTSSSVQQRKQNSITSSTTTTERVTENPNGILPSNQPHAAPPTQQQQSTSGALKPIANTETYTPLEEESHEEITSSDTSHTAAAISSVTLSSATLANLISNNSNALQRPTISLPKTKSYDNDEDDQNDSNTIGQEQLHQKTFQKNNSTNSLNTKSLQDFKKDNKQLPSKSQTTGQNSGWFGGIWNKFSLKPKNQMILPDDKNPTIVWDNERKRWVNTDGGDDNEEESIKPPPKLMDFRDQQQISQPPQQQHQGYQQNVATYAPLQNPVSNASPLPTFVPNTGVNAAADAGSSGGVAVSSQPSTSMNQQTNMFKLQRNRTLKNSYVDVFNPTGAPVNKAVENVLAPAVPPAAVPQTGFFIPNSSNNSAMQGSSVYSGQPQQQQQQQIPSQMTQFYNPNQFARDSGY